MQYRETIKNIVHNSALVTLLITLDRDLNAYGQRHMHRTPPTQSNDWYRMNETAIAPSDYWFRAVGCRKPRQPLDK